MQIANIFNIQRFSVNDGPGIRTAVFIKGCPLNCIWCHNPESKCRATELMYSAEKCVGCGRCASVCPVGCHKIEAGRHVFDRGGCTLCGECSSACAAGAIQVCGRQMRCDEVLSEVMKDKIFYETSGGGVTLSGGEPLYSFEFTLELLRACKESGIHTAMETCGFAPAERIKEAARYTDLFLFDYKETDPTLHKRYTGVDNSLILSNLALVNSLGKETVLRCPIIPGCNDRREHFLAIGELARKYDSLIGVDVEPYHPLGESKAEQLGKEYSLSGKPFAERDSVSEWIRIISENTDKPVKQG